jgi:dinuclear metal center YbgI/SA1388 family protein
MKIDALIHVIQEFAPPELAEPWDKTGLQVGSEEGATKRVLLCIDLTEAVVHEAMSHKAGLIVAYHPPVYSPIQTLTPADWKQRALLACVKHDIAVYSPHTALDAAADGLNQWLAMGLGTARDIRPIRPRLQAELGKLVVFVPAAHANAMREALHQAGAGRFGQYSRCSFNITGQGTFQGDADSHPALGKPGRFERVEEIRMEMIFPWPLRQKMADTLRAVHPYEEPAFDIYALQSLIRPSEMAGQGRVVTLRESTSLDTLGQRVKKVLGVKHVTLQRAAGKARRIRTIGLCAGAGGSLLGDAGEIDAFFTGEMRYHDMLRASQRGVSILLAGHRETEAPFLPVWRERLAKVTGKAVTWRVSRV